MRLFCSPPAPSASCRIQSMMDSDAALLQTNCRSSDFCGRRFRPGTTLFNAQLERPSTDADIRTAPRCRRFVSATAALIVWRFQSWNMSIRCACEGGRLHRINRSRSHRTIRRFGFQRRDSCCFKNLVEGPVEHGRQALIER